MTEPAASDYDAYAGQFDAAVSYLVLNDVRDFPGFAVTLASSLRPGGRLPRFLLLALAFRNLLPARL